MATALLDIDEALRRVLAQVRVAADPWPGETVAWTEAWGRVLAADVHADLDTPAFDRSAMDGIAIVAADAREPGAIVAQLGEAPAGQPFAGRVIPGSCVRIMTGGVVPAGADAVVPVERIEAVATADGRPAYRLLDACRPENHIARRGCEVRRGDVVLERGTRLNGARVGVLATFGHVAVPVARRPTVAILPTGNEIVPVGQTPGPGQVRDANRHALTGLLQGAGVQVVQAAVAPDRKEDLAAAIAAAWQTADVVVMSGGVSAGDYDLVAPALADLGAVCHVHQIRIKPGKPFLFATLDQDGRRRFAFGLPGNPISSYVCAALFVLPALAALQGEAADAIAWRAVQVPSLEAVTAAGPRTEILPARLVQVNGTTGASTRVELLRVRGSADLAHFAAADWLVLRPASSPAAPAGTLVDVLTWPRP